MKAGLADLNAFLAVAQARGFRDAGRTVGSSASTLSEAVRRLETRLGVRLLHRSTRSVTPTEAGTRLMERLAPALGEVEAALNVVNLFRDRPAGMLKLNVPVSAARLVLPSILPGFLAAYPDIQVEIIAKDGFVDMVASGCDAGIRYDERLERDMIAVPIGPRLQRFATAASPAYLDTHGRLDHPREAMVVAFRRHTLLPLDDCLYALQPSILHLTRSALHRCLQRHGISRLPDIEGDKPKRQRFKRYPIGFFHIDIAEVQTAEGKLYLFVGIDRTSKFAVTQLVDKADRRTAWEFLEHLLKAVPYGSSSRRGPAGVNLLIARP